jgi:hypothetical protein
MKSIRNVALLIVIFLTATQFLFIGTFSARAADLQSDLSKVGTRAFTDLTRCINTKKSLEVYYLIDESDSLKFTDPSQDRADILASSVRALGAFRGVNVKYAYGFFGDSFEPVKSWTQVSPENVESAATSLSSEVKGRDNKQNTNWQAGLDGAATLLKQQARLEDSCQALIWLTDGGLWIHEQNNSTVMDETAVTRAAATLCNSTMESLRAGNVSVLGILLKNDNALAGVEKSNPDYYKNNLSGMQLMRPLIEGTGTLFAESGQARSCGTVPIPKNYSPGALLIAKDPVGLALQFMILTSAVEGGTQVQIPATDPLDFRVEPGVRKFRLLTTSADWSLTDAKGIHYGPNSPLIDVQASNGVSQITVGRTIPIEGSWSFKSKSANPVNRLILFSGLGITMNSGTLTAGKDGQLTGAIKVVEGSGSVDLKIYGSYHFSVEAVKSDGSTQTLIRDNITDTGTFETKFKPDENQGKVELRASLTLTTKSGQALQPVSISSWLEVKVPNDYPTIVTPISMSKLDDNKGSISTGSIELVGPKNGTGQVCFKDQVNMGIVIARDAINRKNRYSWKVIDPPKDNCKVLASGQVVLLKLSVTNPTGADAVVQASIPVMLKSDAHPKSDIAFSAVINLPTSLYRPGLWLWNAVIILFSVILPLLLLYFLNWISAKFILGYGIQRAVYQVRLTQDGGITDLSGESLEKTVKDDDFNGIGASENSREYEDDRSPGLLFTSYISKLPLSEPRFEVKPESGGQIITMISTGNRLKKRFAAGEKAPTRADLGNFWALVISDAEKTSWQERGFIEGLLVIYKRNRMTLSNQYVDRVLEVVKTPGIWEQFIAISQFASTSGGLPQETWNVGSPDDSISEVPKPPSDFFPPPPE